MPYLTCPAGHVHKPRDHMQHRDCASKGIASKEVNASNIASNDKSSDTLPASKSILPRKQRWDRDKYNAYMKEYMRKRSEKMAGVMKLTHGR